MTAIIYAVALVALAQNPAPPQAPPVPTLQAGAEATTIPGTEALPLQVALDRAGFSPGVIDGRTGPNTRRALEAYKRANGPANPNPVPGVVAYTITPEDAAGPFVPEIPSDLVEQAKLPALGYRSMLEALAERFHCTPALLQRLNPGAQFAAGEQIQVPNVEPLVAPVEKPPMSAAERSASKTDRPAGTSGTGKPEPKRHTVEDRPDVVVTVSKSASALTVKERSGRVIFYAPVTTGSERDPLPIGEWKVNGVQFTPQFRYNPDLFWDADPAHSKATIPPGPNNPVGMVWIDISKEHYGIHGTPEPSAIGRTESHGCVRLTNWDALKLAGMVKPGTRVVFTD